MLKSAERTPSCAAVALYSLRPGLLRLGRALPRLLQSRQGSSGAKLVCMCVRDAAKGSHKAEVPVRHIVRWERKKMISLSF